MVIVSPSKRSSATYMSQSSHPGFLPRCLEYALAPTKIAARMGKRQINAKASVCWFFTIS
jgi:hypothetical protein